MLFGVHVSVTYYVWHSPQEHLVVKEECEECTWCHHWFGDARNSAVPLN